MQITYDQWMELTRLGLFKPRSDALVRVDKSLLQYDVFPSQKHLRRLRNSFDLWKREKGPKWEKSERNHKGAVTKLARMLEGPPAELGPMDYLLAMQKKRIDHLFRGRKLTTKNSSIAMMAGMAALSGENVRRGAVALGAPTNFGFEKVIRETIGKFFGSSDHSVEVEIANYLGKNFLPDLTKSLTPYAGILTAGANAMFQFGKLGLSAYRLYEVHECRDAVRTGDPTAAVAAMQRVLNRDITGRAVRGTMAAFEAISRGAASAVGGPAAETIAAGVMSVGKLMNMIYQVGRDFQEKSAANKILSGSDLIDYTVFDKHPLIGCYYVVCVDTSDLVNFMLNDMGTEDWMTDVEKLTKRVQPILSIGRILIDDARFEIAKMPKLPKKGVEVSLKQKLKFKMNAVAARSPF